MEETQTENTAENGSLASHGDCDPTPSPVTGHGNSEVALARSLPHNYADIVKDADEPFDRSSEEKIWEQLLAGVVLLNRRRKYWVDEKLNKNCFIVYAREFAITWGDNPEYWKWVNVKETGDVDIEVARLRTVCWLHISGNFQTISLSPKTKYQVVLVVMMGRYSAGWYEPMNFSIDLPDGSKLEKNASFQGRPTDRWMNVVMGEFEMTPATVGEIKFSISEHSTGWKQGMDIKGVAFQPLN